MNKKLLIVIIVVLAAVAVVVTYFSLRPEKTPRIFHIGVLSFSAIEDPIAGFKNKMTELGYLEGENVIYDIQPSPNDASSVQNIAKKFIEEKADLIFAFPCFHAINIKKNIEGTGIPTVFAICSVEGTGLIDSVKQPGDDITGVRNAIVDWTIKRLEFLLEIKPAIKRIWIPYSRDFIVAQESLKMLRQFASSRNITLIEFPVDSVKEIETDLEARVKSGDIGMDAILKLASPVTDQAADIILNFSKQYKIPFAALFGNEVYNGALLSYTASNSHCGELAAISADKIFRGIPAGTIPVATAEPELKINYKTAQELGLTIPEGLLSRADEIIR